MFCDKYKVDCDEVEICSDGFYHKGGYAHPCCHHLADMRNAKIAHTSNITRPEYSIEDYKALNLAKVNEQSLNTLLDICKRDNPIEFFKENDIRALWVYGTDSNAGKSTLAANLFWKIAEKNMNARYFSFSEITEKISDFKKKDNFLKKINELKIYYIDDFLVTDRAYIQPHAKPVLYSLINNIFEKKKYMIVTSNKALIDIDSEYSSIQSVIQRSYLELEFKGSIIKPFPTKKIKKRSVIYELK